MTKRDFDRPWFFLDIGATPAAQADAGGVVECPVDVEPTVPIAPERNDDVPAHERRDRAIAKLKHAQAAEVLRLRGVI